MTSKEKGIWNNKPFWCILLFGLAVLCSNIKVLVLPQGGSLTYFSLMILWLMTFIYGPRYGLIASVLFGCVRLGITYLTGEYINPNIWSILLEYPVAHGVFCLGGFFNSLFYNIIYDSSYLLIEGTFSLLLLCVPKVADAIYYIKHVATHIDEDDTLECF